MLALKENHMWMIKEKEEEKVEALEIMELVDGELTNKGKDNFEPRNEEETSPIP